MKIYTKGGDTGETGLYGGVRVPKDDLRIQAYGTLDELNAVFGVILASSGVVPAIQTRLLKLQGELFQVGAELATPHGKKIKSELVDGSQVEALEKMIDEMEIELPPLKTFILPGGSK